MTMFITGGTSSIGRVLVKELAAQGTPMRLLIRKNSDRSGLELPQVTFIEGDVTDPEAVRQGMQGCQTVTHLAAVVGQNLPEAEWWRVNRDGSRNVLQAAVDLQIPSMVQVSSISVLGHTRPDEIADETRPVDTSKYLSLYQKTKHAADEIAREFAAKGLPVKIVYPTFGYGCSHAVAGILLAHEKGQAGEGYILGNENLTFPEIWAAIAQVLGKQPPRRRIPLPVLKLVSSASRFLTGKSVFPPDFFDMIGLDWCFSAHKAQEQLGWRRHSFLDGMQAAWAGYQHLVWSLH